ncbi:MAG: SGNH/GDSL hydrolase family protein [Verrucomicrobiales bacterium]
MKRRLILAALLIAAAPLCLRADNRPLQPKPADPYFEKYVGLLAPGYEGSLLKKGDRLAIIGDSITEQKMYSVIMETYLTACTPELDLGVRQFGWSGEKADGFYARMEQDCLRFDPTVATTCYGMNDHRYVPYTDEIGDRYRDFQTKIVQRFKEAGVRVVLGSPGTIGKMPGWVKSATGTKEDLNLSLCKLRNIDIEIAKAEDVRFGDVYWPMLTAGFAAQQKFGQGYDIYGKDGVHPGWAGQTVMAYAFLKALGVNGEIGTIEIDLGAGKASASDGHEVAGCEGGTATLKSRRYPFCAAGGDPSKDDNIRSAMGLIPFNEELNRFVLKATNATAETYTVTWGDQSRDYSRADLENGVNLAADFHVNPFSQPFQEVWDRVAAKQAYETRQIKDLFHGREGAADIEMTAALTEKARQPLADAIKRAMRPVEHAITVAPKG